MHGSEQYKSLVLDLHKGPEVITTVFQVAENSTEVHNRELPGIIVGGYLRQMLWRTFSR